jgi:hypothetical protein
VADNELFGSRRRTHEDEYFRRQEQEVIEKLKQRGRDEAARRQLAERTGLADEELLKDLMALGYTPETVMLLHLVPLVQMAWAEGSVSERERDLIVEAARARGIDAGSAADVQLRSWLTTRPSQELFDQTLRAIRTILEAGSADARDAGERDLLAHLTSIASASGGILGFGKVSPEEQEVLSRVTAEIQRAHS